MKQVEGPPAPRLGNAGFGLRCWPVKGFGAIRFYYLETPGSLRVVRILHGRRNVRHILKDEHLP